MSLIDYDTCPFEPSALLQTLDIPVAREPLRAGEGGRPCPNCTASDSAYLWTNERWRIRLKEPTSLRGTVILETRGHYDSFADLPISHTNEIGFLAAKIERAILQIDNIARVHVLRWGDGTAHFHMYFYARPFGQLQLRGTFMEVWELILPPLPPEEVRSAGVVIAESLDVPNGA